MLIDMLNYTNWLLMDVNGIDKPTYGHYTDGRSLEDPSQMGDFPANIFDDQTLQEAMLLNPKFFGLVPSIPMHEVSGMVI